MERPVNDMDVFTKTPFQLHHKFPDNFQKRIRATWKVFICPC